MAESLMEKLDLALTGKGENTKRVYESITRKIIERIGKKEEFGPKGWQKYLNYLEKTGKSESYKNTSYYVYKKLVQLTGGNVLALPDAPDVEERDKIRTTLDTKSLSNALKMISKLRLKEQISLGLGAFYGFRNSEIGRIEPSDFESDEIFNAPTVKKGVQKYHYIPKQLRDFINPDYSEELNKWISNYESPYHAIHYKMFYKIFYPLKPSEEKRYGWHTVRRKLVREFDNLIINWRREKRKEKRQEIPFNVEQVNRFMRWARGESMYHTYAQRPRSLSKIEDIETDEIIFENHPFFKYLD